MAHSFKSDAHSQRNYPNVGKKVLSRRLLRIVMGSILSRLRDYQSNRGGGNLPRSEIKGLDGPEVNTSSSSTTMSYALNTGSNQSLTRSDSYKWQEFLGLLSYLANLEETVTFSGSEESNYSTTFSFWTEKNRYQVTLPKLEPGLLVRVTNPVTTKGQLSFWKRVIWDLKETFFYGLAALTSLIRG